MDSEAILNFPNNSQANSIKEQVPFKWCHKRAQLLTLLSLAWCAQLGHCSLSPQPGGACGEAANFWGKKAAKTSDRSQTRTEALEGRAPPDGPLLAPLVDTTNHLPQPVFTFRSWQVGGTDNFSWLKNFQLCSLLQEALNQFTARMCACVLSYEQAEEHWPLRTFSYSCHMRASWESPHQMAGWTRHPGSDVYLGHGHGAVPHNVNSYHPCVTHEETKTQAG